MSALLHLTDAERKHAERIFVASAHHLIAAPDSIDYSQNAVLRWEGITKHLRSYKHQYPRHGDCSATGIWMRWDATLRFDLPAIQKNAAVHGGYTGTILDEGVAVKTEHFKIMDAAVYGSGTGEHVVWYIGDGVWFSHGSQGGPYPVNLHYRGGPIRIRRLIA